MDVVCEEWNVHINTVRPQKPEQMVFGIVSVCSMASVAHGELPIAATQNDNIKKKRTNKSLKPPSSFWHDFWRKIKWANWQNMKEMAKRNRKWTKRNVTADALAMCMLRVVHAHCHHLTHPRHYTARSDPTPTGFESSMQSTAAFTRISILWGPLWDFLLCIVDADICLLFRLLLFTAHSSSMF